MPQDLKPVIVGTEIVQLLVDSDTGESQGTTIDAIATYILGGGSTHPPLTLAADTVTDDTLDLSLQELSVNLVDPVGETDGVMQWEDKDKLDNIEANATADQTGAEIKALYEAEPNAFTDILYTKLDNIETGATADQNGAEIKALYEAEPNAFTDTLYTKLDNIEANATADQDADEVPYDNSTSGLTSIDVQSAIDEIEDRVDTLEGVSGHDALTLNAGTITQDSASLAGQELTLDEVTTTTYGVMSPTDKTKIDFISVTQAVNLDTMESDITANNAKLTADTTNVTAAGALMDSEVTNLAQVKAFSSADYATAAQGTLADSAIQPGDNISTLTNDSNYITAAGAPVQSVNTQTGIVVLDADDISDAATTNKFTTAGNISKLAGIEDNAEVNNISDANATDLTDAGDTTLHYHSADRDRANHTGTQAASTISDFDTEVSNNVDVAANTSKLAGIEVGATADQTGAEIKALYEVEANAFTDTLFTKLNNIEANADVTDEANVTDALDGATLSDIGTPASTDRILIQDADDSFNLKYAEFSEFAGGGGGLTAVQSYAFGLIF